MITAVDTNIFLSILTGGPDERLRASESLLQARSGGQIVTSVICYAELVPHFADRTELNAFLAGLDCRVLPPDENTAYLAGRLFADYRRRGGSRTRILADFLVAATAQPHADRLLTNDKQFFSPNFSDLKVIPTGIT